MTAAVCLPPSAVPEFSSLLKKDPASGRTMLDDDPGPEACNSALTGQAATDCASFTAWTQYTASFAGVLGTAANLVGQLAPSKLQPVIIGSLKAVYLAVAGVNQQFLTAIHDVNNNIPYNPMPMPDPIPPFPDPTKGKNIGQAIESAWEIFKPFLEKAISKLPSGSPWIKVLEGLIAASSQVIAQLKKLFDALG